jgi:hypothetical protein
MVPATLSAAEPTELATCDLATVKLALELWHLAPQTAPDEGAELAAALRRWWTVYQEHRPPWVTALAALEAMLSELPEAGAHD